jgi:hypothetical protein
LSSHSGDSLEYVSTRTFSIEDYQRFKRHGVIGEDWDRWDRLEDISFMRHGMSAQDVLNHMNRINNDNGGEL